MSTEHVTITDPELHEPKDISTATAGQVYVSIGGGAGVWATLAGDNLVLVNSASDFPAPVAGVITLEDEHQYVTTAPISVSDRFEWGDGSSITSNSILGPTLTYTGTGSMFSGDGKGFLLRDIQVDCPNGQVFNLTDSVGGVGRTSISGVAILSCVTVGVFADLRSLVADNFTVISATNGITLSGSTGWLVASFLRTAMISTSASFIGIDYNAAVLSNIEMQNLIMTAPAGAVGFSGAANNANVAVGSVATITNSTFLGGMTPVTGIDVENDVRWFSEQNSANVPDTKPDAMASLTANATNTEIVTGGVAVLVAGTWVDQRSSHYTVSTAGRITYVGEKPLAEPFEVILNMEPISGTNKNLSVQIFKNGSLITGTKMQALTNSGNPLIFTTMWQLQLVQNDFLEVFVSNETDTVDVNVNDAIFRLR